MDLGWIDFSESDRKLTLDVIHQFEGHTAYDELGIGIIRDAFSDIFFPGISTIQTRAKYFIIIPQIMMDCVAKGRGKKVIEVIGSINKMEQEFAIRMVKNQIYKGVIGAEVVRENCNKWVVRKPYTVYWNGIKQLSIFKQKELSVANYIAQNISKSTNELLNNYTDPSKENEQDDRDAGKELTIEYWDEKLLKLRPWTDNVDMELDRNQAEFLRDKMQNKNDSLLSYFLSDKNRFRNIQKLEGDNLFEMLYDYCKTEDHSKELSQNLLNVMSIAIQFNRLVYMCRVLYNQIYSGGENSKANAAWQDCISKGYVKSLNSFEPQNLCNITQNIDKNTKQFIQTVKTQICNNQIEAAKQTIIQREKSIKHNYAKLGTEHTDKDKWIGGGYLDYRFYISRQIVIDIYNGLNGGGEHD